MSGSVGMLAFAEAAAASSSSSFSFSCKTKAVSKKVGRCQTGKKMTSKEVISTPVSRSLPSISVHLPSHTPCLSKGLPSAKSKESTCQTITIDFHKNSELSSKAAADQANQPAEDSNEGTNICIAIGIGPATVVAAKTLLETWDRHQNLLSSLLFDLQIGKHGTRRPWAKQATKKLSKCCGS